jgi:hypothetical protein
MPSEWIVYATTIGTERHRNAASRPLHSGGDQLHNDIIGTIGEVAVCLFYGEDPRRYVTAHDERPGTIPDLVHDGYRVSVKSTERFKLPLTLFVPEHDPNDVFVLVSVAATFCRLHGWCDRSALDRFPAEPFKRIGQPGSSGNGRYHYIPVGALEPCNPWLGVSA